MVALLSLSSWCLMIVVWLFLAVQWVCLQFVIVIFPDHTHILFLGVIHANSHGSGESANLNLLACWLKCLFDTKYAMTSLHICLV